MPFDFSDKVALVTGGASGIGRATAVKLGEGGATVVVADVDEDGARQTVRELEAAGRTAMFVRADVSSEDDVVAMVKAATDAFGRIDLAFNNAGVEGELKPLHETSLVDFQRTTAINLTGVFLCMKHELRPMLSQGHGAIVNTASVAGLRGSTKLSPYVASKHAVVGLTKAAAVEYSRHGVRINAICPAVIRTPMVERALVEVPKLAPNMERLHPIGRLGEPSEVADLVAFLFSAEATFLTGGIYTAHV